MRNNNGLMVGKRILIVEDVELNQYLARHIMESWGCVVDVAENGKVAVDMLIASEFDLVLMDIQMPVMDGMEATRQIRSMSCARNASVPIVALTANASKQEYNVYIQTGMNDCLPKPFEEAALFAMAATHIRKENTEWAGTFPKLDPAPVVAPMESKYDLAMIEAISGGDQEFIQKMLRLFLDTVPVSLNELRAAEVAKDWLQLSKLAHKLKSTIDSMGITALKQDIRTIESDGKSDTNVDRLPALVIKVVAVMESVMVQVKKDHHL